MLALRNTYPSINLLDSFFDDLFEFKTLSGNGMVVRNPLHDIIETEKDFQVQMALAGVKKEDITLNVENGVLNIKAERKASDQKFNIKQTFYGKYEKSFTLPDSVDGENIQAAFEDGMLKLTIPKLVELKKEKVKQIEIT
jgi:HSP20 family protein